MARPATKKPKLPMYELHVTYPMKHWPELDKVICKALHKRLGDTGTDFKTRDLWFPLRSHTELLDAQARLGHYRRKGVRYTWTRPYDVI